MEPRSRKTCLHWLSKVPLAGFFTNNSLLWRADIPLAVENDCMNWLPDLSFLYDYPSSTWHLFELAALRKESWVGAFTCSIVLCVAHLRFVFFSRPDFDEMVCEIKLKKSIVRRILWPKCAKHLLSKLLEPGEVAAGRIFSWNLCLEILKMLKMKQLKKCNGERGICQAPPFWKLLAHVVPIERNRRGCDVLQPSALPSAWNYPQGRIQHAIKFLFVKVMRNIVSLEVLMKRL